MRRKGKLLYLLAILLFSAVVLSFRPGMWLIHKPASSQNEQYVNGWEDGCISGTNSYSLLYAPLLDKPFIKNLDSGVKAADTAEKSADKTASSGKDNYKSGWNEGSTLCRFYQSSVYELMQFAVIVATLLFIGYQLKRSR